MSRLCAPLFFSAFLFAACVADVDDVEHAPLTGAAQAPVSVVIPVLPTPRPTLTACPPAPAGTMDCGSDMACNSDGDCSIYPGNYCAADTCVQDGCLRGRCSPTRVQGETCTRGGECSSGVCDCGTGGGPCVCTPGKGVLFVF